MTTRLCLCADDFGLDAFINAAIRALAEAGRLQATGVLVGAPAWRQERDWLRTAGAYGLEVGLHLDFTEVPLTPGARQPLGRLIAQCYAGRLEVARVHAEIQAQLAAFEDGLGRPPAFVDGHQHVHQLPVIRSALLETLQQRYPPAARPWLRRTAVRWPAARVAGPRAAAKATQIAALGARGLAAAARRQGFAQNQTLLGVYGFNAEPARFAVLLRGWLAAARDGDLLMCHPGDGARDALASARQAEFAALAAPELDGWLAQAQIRLQPMRATLMA